MTHGIGAGPLVCRDDVVRVEPAYFVDWRRVLFADVCPYCVVFSPCEGKQAMSIEHVQPRSKGGPNHWTNYVGVHKGGNVQRGDKKLVLFLLFRYEYSKVRGRKGTDVRRHRQSLRMRFRRDRPF